MTVYGSLSLVPATTANHVIDVIVQKRPEEKPACVCYTSHHKRLSFPTFLCVRQKSPRITECHVKRV